jgi:hypothetical protein
MDAMAGAILFVVHLGQLGNRVLKLLEHVGEYLFQQKAPVFLLHYDFSNLECVMTW